MRDSLATQAIVEKLMRLISVHQEAEELLHDMISMLRIDHNGPHRPSPRSHTARHGIQSLVSAKECHPVADRGSWTIRWRGKECFLGNTISFRLFERLTRRPGQMVSHEQLLDDVWHGVRSKEAIRSAIKILRNKLRKEGIPDLADAIEPGTREHYRLMLDQSG